MARLERFTFLCNQDERQLIVALADRLRRSQSDTVRVAIFKAANELLRQDFRVESLPIEYIEQAVDD